MLVDPCWTPDSPYDKYDFTHYLMEDVDWFGEAMSVILVLGAFVAVTPQIITLAKKKTSNGISGTMLFFQGWNQVFYLCNMTMNQFNRLAACGNSFKKCWANGFMNWFQPLALGCGTGVYYIQYLYYFKKESKATKEPKQIKTANMQIISFICLSIFALIVLGLLFYSGAFYGECDKVYVGFSTAFSIFGAIFSMFMYIPQIIKICKNKSPGSYSIISVAIMAVGGIASIVTFFTNSVNWTIYIVTVAPLIQQLIMLILVIVFTIKKKKGHYKKLDEETANKDEQPLLIESEDNSGSNNSNNSNILTNTDSINNDKEEKVEP